MDVSIIIVNYNTKPFLADCLNSIYEQTKDISFEVIVSDNGSTDGSIEMLKADFPQVILIENNANLGFGAANNRGLAVAKGKYVFYLNSDTILLNNAVKFFFDYWEKSPEKDCLGALGSNLLAEDEKTITTSHGCFFNFFGDFKLYVKDWLCLFKPQENTAQKTEQKFCIGDVDVVIGADLFVRNDEYAVFDEYFFLYHEETDLQLRLKNAGKRRMLIEGPKIVHLEGKSNLNTHISYSDYVSFSRIQDRISRVKFYKKNGTHWYEYRILKLLVLLIWMFPPLFRHTKKYISQLLRI